MVDEFTVTIRVLATVLPGTAITLTALRLYCRWTRRHLGWDDAWAAVAMVFAFLLCAGEWTRSDDENTGPLFHGKRVQLVGYYMQNVGFTGMIWAARLSILASIMRIIPCTMPLRAYARASAIVFCVMWAELIVHKVAICETQTEWKTAPGTQCKLGLSVAVAELSTDFIADLVLTLLPMRLLWRMSLSPGPRALLIGLFSASMLTTVVSVIHAIYVVGPNRQTEAISAHVQASTSVIVCNLVVLVTWLVRAVRRRATESGASSSDEQSVMPPGRMTTLRFGHGEPLTVLSGVGADAKPQHGGGRESDGDSVFAQPKKKHDQESIGGNLDTHGDIAVAV